MRLSLRVPINKIVSPFFNKDSFFAVSLFLVINFCVVSFVVQATQATQPIITEQQAKALTMLNQQGATKHQVKSLRLQIEKLTDSQGQIYLGASVNRVELLPYLTQLKALLKDDFQSFRANQAARDHQSFHLTLLSPKEYQLADKALIEKLLAPSFNSNFSSQLNVTLLGLGKAEQGSKKTFFVVAQSNDAQLIRQHFLLQSKDFHVTLGFSPSDIYSVKKDRSTLID